jgi:hypothetical protein
MERPEERRQLHLDERCRDDDLREHGANATAAARSDQRAFSATTHGDRPFPGGGRTA